MNCNLYLQSGIFSGLGTGASILAHNAVASSIFPISCLQGFGIGAIAGIISMIVNPCFSRTHGFCSIASYLAINTVAIYGVTAAAAALGFVAAPITFPTALMLAIGDICFQILLGYCIINENDDEHENCMDRYCRDVFRVQQNPIEIFNVIQDQVRRADPFIRD